MAYLENFEPPEFQTEDATLRAELQTRIVFHALQMPSSNTTRLLFTYVVTTDKAVREYMAGCRRVREHMIENGGIQEYVEGVGHFENCINAVKRALRAFERIGRQMDGPEINRIIRKHALSQSIIITKLRDATEHMDEEFVSDTKIPEGAPHLLTIDKSGKSLKIGTHSITFIDLHSVIRAMQKAGHEIIQALPESADA